MRRDIFVIRRVVLIKTVVYLLDKIAMLHYKLAHFVIVVVSLTVVDNSLIAICAVLFKYWAKDYVKLSDHGL